MGLLNLLSKSVFVTKFACANVAAKTSAESLLSSGVVIYLPWLWVIFVLYNLFFFCFFLTKRLIFGILFSTAVNAAFVAKPLILGILVSISVILAL